MSRSVSAHQAFAPRSADDAQTTVMSRATLPLAGRRGPLASEERTVVDCPRPADRSDEHTIVSPLVFPKTSRAITPAPSVAAPPRPLAPAPPEPRRSDPAPSGVRPASRVAAPPPLPAPRRALGSSPAGRGSGLSPLPRLIPPPPPSATKLFEGPSLIALPGAALPSSPALVSDVRPPVVPPAPARGRAPMLVLAVAVCLLGIIFALGVVVGLVASLRSRAVPAAAAGEATPIVMVDAIKAAPAPKSVPAPALPDALAVAKDPVVAAPLAPRAITTPARAARAAAAVAAPKPLAPSPAVAAARRGRAPASDPDLDAANAAADLARAQLESSLR